jgi:hypothetical protein
VTEFGFREFVAMVLLGYFGWAFYQNPTNETIIGALLMAFAGAWGFYLGGSKVGSDTATKNADTVAAQAQGATDTAAGKSSPESAQEAAGEVADAAVAKADEISSDRQTVGFGNREQ